MIHEPWSILLVRRPSATEAVVSLLIRRIAFGCIAFLLCSCGGPTPEARLRATIERGVRAAERNDLASLHELVSSRYSDAEGQGRDGILDRVGGYLGYLRPVHVFKLERSLVVSPAGHAEVTMLVAIASVPIESLAELRNTSADIGRVEMVFSEEGGEWKLIRAAWGPAEPTDFF